MSLWHNAEDKQQSPDIRDDDEVFTVSLVTVEVREAHFYFQIHEPCVLHLGLAVGWEVTTLCPFNGGAVEHTPTQTHHTHELVAYQFIFLKLHITSN